MSSPEQLAALLNAAAERMIPATDTWPSATAIGMGEDVIAELRDAETAEVAAALARLSGAQDFRRMSPEAQDAALAALERDDPPGFGTLRQVIYLAYYAQPAVIEVLRRMGHDLNEAPQPDGYRMDSFDPGRVPQDGRGVWIPTEQVTRVSEGCVR
ncbi:gluconate 2-dehydrogenase subunit 3 family protein [Pseudonocardia hispaniensis]|uniref:Gluconate 2-dehydrogenase subunit 3 family protein n=1 Tax=Pseudonocardia hispaniensis TaxID=904933 RepID=A0ABW1J7N9_9PSEU